MTDYPCDVEPRSDKAERLLKLILDEVSHRIGVQMGRWDNDEGHEGHDVLDELDDWIRAIDMTAV